MSRKNPGERDPLGKAALFSDTTEQRPMFGVVGLDCSLCERETAVRFRDLPGLLFPLPVTLPKRHHTWMKCPSCGRRAWMRARWRI